MKKIFSIVLLISLMSCSNADKTAELTGSETAVGKNSNTETNLKRYAVKSGIVKYKTTINGKVMGQTVSGEGTEELYFKNWGALELKKEDSKKTTKINMFGQKKTEVEEIHTINKLDNGKSYSVNFKNKTIFLRRDPAMEMMKTFNNGDVESAGKKMLESIGGKKIGNENILGYNCEVWQIPGGKQWIYKGLPLKLEVSMMGIKTINEATSARFNTSVPDKYFELPDYPIQKEEGFRNDAEYSKDKAEMKKNAQKLQKMSYEEYKSMLKKNDPEEYKNMSEKEMKASYQMMKKMANAMGR